MKDKNRFLWIRVLSILAIFISSILLYAHYKETPAKFCKIGDSFDCEIVNKSVYSTIDGIFYFLGYDLNLPIPDIYFPMPVAALSILVFLFILTASFTIPHKKSLFGIKPSTQATILKTLIILSMLLAVYLLYIETFILLAYCIYCISLDIIMIGMLPLIIGIKP